MYSLPGKLGLVCIRPFWDVKRALSTPRVNHLPLKKNKSLRDSLQVLGQGAPSLQGVGLEIFIFFNRKGKWFPLQFQCFFHSVLHSDFRWFYYLLTIFLFIYWFYLLRTYSHIAFQSRKNGLLTVSLIIDRSEITTIRLLLGAQNVHKNQVSAVFFLKQK